MLLNKHTGFEGEDAHFYQCPLSELDFGAVIESQSSQWSWTMFWAKGRGLMEITLS